MGFELQVANHAEPKRHVALIRMCEEDDGWLTLCHDAPVDGCLPSPIRYEWKTNAQDILAKLYPELAAHERRVVPARSVVPGHEEF